MNNKLSEKPWGDVDKDELLKFVINHPKMADKIYLKIEKDWKDNPREKPSYPIADKNGTVYRYGLSSALTYAKANNETEVVKKVKALYKKYGINEDLSMKNKIGLIIEGLENRKFVSEGFTKSKILDDSIIDKIDKGLSDKLGEKVKVNIHDVSRGKSGGDRVDFDFIISVKDAKQITKVVKYVLDRIFTNPHRKAKSVVKVRDAGSESFVMVSLTV